ncbi:hypothetical protein B7P43_G13681 [Cryptotermes secundus]|uniref:CRAL-TRIO domain-containing protein n=5 Tax=Cryptotermes secundus TaxID=105785 RepID=A0A2J7Q1U2_9NEOP|nr:hypothetical protein B7P43_G13681 [Cryptotermes secundus]PNF22554.1 hypothetical protein B7P43_G13681 [Cryptotermes secundus]
MVLQGLPPEMVDIIYEELGLNEQDVEDYVKMLKEWLHKQPHLPHINDDLRLERVVLQCKGRMEIAKSVIDMYFTLRGKIPEVLSNRDPFAPWFKDLTDRILVVPLPNLTNDFCRVTIIAAINPPPDIRKFDPVDIMKLAFMVQDIRLAEDIMLADIIICDVQKGTPAHAAKFTLPFFKKLALCALRGYKARVKTVHVLNATQLMDAVFRLGKAVVKQKHRDRLIVHRDGYLKGYDSLHEYIPPKILPREYGGEAGSILDMWAQWKEKIYSYREWFLKEGALTSDESKRPEKAIDTGELFGFEGSFRQLNVD